LFLGAFLLHVESLVSSIQFLFVRNIKIVFSDCIVSSVLGLLHGPEAAIRPSDDVSPEYIVTASIAVPASRNKLGLILIVRVGGFGCEEMLRKAGEMRNGGTMQGRT
jgi:hypothetical protein